MAIAANATPAPDRLPVRRALLSVFDKTGLIDLASALHARGVELVSTGGSAKALKEAGLPVADVSSVTGFPEVMDGRVKTLHPSVHGGLLAIRNDPAHAAAMREHGIEGIDLLVVNLYPFAEVEASGAEPSAVIENIDIGGPAMIRAAAKNHAHVATIVDVDDYAALLAELDANGGATTEAFRQRMAQAAYARTAAYDAAVSTWMAGAIGADTPRRRAFAGSLAQPLRYGENPHQQAAFYRDLNPAPGALALAETLQGKALSFNNLADADAAWECVKQFDPQQDGAACVIVKHANPCGVAVAECAADAYRKAFATDPTSAFGGIIAFNTVVDAAAAEALTQQFLEVVIAPDYTQEARARLAEKKNVRVLRCPWGPAVAQQDLKRIGGGLLVQSNDTDLLDPAHLKVVTRRTPTQDEMRDLLFVWRVAKFVKSNAIVYGKNGQTIGIGAGQMSRVDSSRIAVIKAQNAGLEVRGSVVASDAFFPFRDGVDVLAQAGATAVIQPGGSVRDEEVIAAANEHGLAMVFTGMLHFRH